MLCIWHGVQFLMVKFTNHSPCTNGIKRHVCIHVATGHKGVDGKHKGVDGKTIIGEHKE